MYQKKSKRSLKSKTILYESTIQGKKNFKQIKEKMKKDQVEIEKLYGRRGILAEKEYQILEKNS